MIKVDGRNIHITQANSGTLSFVFNGPDGGPLDLYDYDITFMVKQSKQDPDSEAFITKFYDEIEDYVLEVNLTKTDTAIPVGYYWWSIVLTNGDFKDEAISGQFYIIDGVQD